MANDGTAAQLYFELNTGAKMPAVGLGTWQAEPGVVGNSVKKAIEVGYRHIDCARVYGNEKENVLLNQPASRPNRVDNMATWVGVALKEILSTGAVKRDDLWITSKLWLSDCSPEKAPAAIDATLEDLQLDYVDLYLVHWPNKYIASTWEAMEKILETGKVRAIGVSNFSVKKLQELIKHAKVIPAVNQVECHPVWQQQKLHEYCKSQNIHLSAYSPIGSPGTGLVKQPVKVLEVPIIKQVAEKLGKTPAQIALRWGLQSGYSILPKSSSESRIKENFDVFDWSIPHELFAQFSEIEQVKQLLGDFLVDSQSDYFTSVEELWDGEF